MSSQFLTALKLRANLVKFSHTLFALPFALGMLLIVRRDYELMVSQILWILVALVAARTAAMAFNRLANSDYDAKNDRTKGREVPAGKISTEQVRELIMISSGVFFLAAAMLGWHCFILSPIVLAILLLYSFSKRFTHLSHFILGLSLAMAPGGVWYAVSGEVALMPVVLMLAIMFWVAGFDILYACQDYEFDRQHGLHSIPVKLGISHAIILARFLHLISLILLWWFGELAQLQTGYAIAQVAFALLLLNQHLIVKASDLSRVDGVFFTRNELASVVLFIGIAVDTTPLGRLIGL